VCKIHASVWKHGHGNGDDDEQAHYAQRSYIQIYKYVIYTNTYIDPLYPEPSTSNPDPYILNC